jgi:hypothetical protein
MKVARTCILLFDGPDRVHHDEGGLVAPGRSDRGARGGGDDLARVGYRIDVGSEPGEYTRFTLCPT